MKECKKLEKFNDQEAKFIAKLILNRLDITPKKARIAYSKKLKSVLSGIERIEKIWMCRANNKHSYGRKEKKEPIRLWSVPKITAKVLGYLAAYTNSKKVLEIGTSAGYSTLHLANAVNQVYTIELLDKKVMLAKKNFSESGLNKKIILIQEKALKALKEWGHGKIDLVFLDADKENYGKYLDLILPHMNLNAILVADNVNDYGHMMEDYLQKVSGTHFVNSRCNKKVRSTYVAQLDNGLIITRKVKK